MDKTKNCKLSKDEIKEQFGINIEFCSNCDYFKYDSSDGTSRCLYIIEETDDNE